jgi:hypothetical protein
LHTTHTARNQQAYNRTNLRLFDPANDPNKTE